MKKAADVFSLLLPFFMAAVAFAAVAAPPPQPPPPSATSRLTVEAIFRGGRFQAQPPSGMTWSPDSKRLMYQDDRGNLMAVDGATGRQTVLIPSGKMKSLSGERLSEVDRALIDRYGESQRFWTPNPKNILLASKGRLWLFDTSKGVGLDLASVGSGRGSNPQFSPDGNYLAYIRGNNLYVLSSTQGQPGIQLTHSAKPSVLHGAIDWVYEEELDVRSNYFWSPDSKHIAFLEMDESAVPTYPNVDLLSVHAMVHAQRYPQAGDPNPAVRVGIISAKGGKPRWIKLPEEEADSYIPRFGWLNSKTIWIETLNREQTRRTIYFADSSQNQVLAALSLKDEKYLQPAYDVEFLDSEFLLINWADGYSHIYRYRFHPEKPLSGTAEFAGELGHGDWDVTSISAIDRRARTVYYLSKEGDPRQQQIWAANLDNGQRHRVSREDGWHKPNFSPDARYYVDAVSSRSSLPVVKLCRGEAGCEVLWKSPATGLQITSPQSLEFTAADGKTVLYGQLVMPAGDAPAKSVPVILNPYGGPEAQSVTDQWNYRTALFDQVLTDHGFAVLRVDNRGMAGRGRDFAQAAYRDFGPVQLSDQIAALNQALVRFPALDGKRVGWWGWSWGGTLTLYAMTHSDRIAAGVAVAPVTDWRNYDSIYTERYLGKPSRNRQEYDKLSLLESAANLHGRLLLAHGLGDENVHFGNSAQFIHKLVEGGIPYDLALYPGKTHSILGTEARIDLYQRILGHFEHHLAPNSSEHLKGAERSAAVTPSSTEETVTGGKTP